ncbi:MAG: hypothetical protein AAF652_10920 [Cyanobacteria bacterium P01_C01_bin.72]
MKPEKLCKLELLQGIPPSFELKKLEYDGNLLVEVQDINCNSSPILTIYSDAPFSVRVNTKFIKPISSYDLDKALVNLEKKSEYEYKWSLFTVENSRYVEWFHEQSVGIKRDIGIAHYLIMTADEVIEVLDLEDPRPTFMWN